MFFREDKVNGKFLKIAQEHEVVLEYLEKLKILLENNDLSYSFKQLKSMLPEFKSEMRHHFKIEEHFLFPAALLCVPSIELVDMIMVLQKEHGFVERDIDTLERMFEDNPKATQMNEAMTGLLKTMIRDIEKHARIEIDHLFPKMDACKKCRKIIKGILLEP
ncbi:hemerythrin domain-containing protein [bacterium]|nr:hemerythrin domain-containing protein [bacterium]